MAITPRMIAKAKPQYRGVALKLVVGGGMRYEPLMLKSRCGGCGMSRRRAMELGDAGVTSDDVCGKDTKRPT